MNDKGDKLKALDIACLGLCALLLGLSFYFFKSSKMVIAVLTLLFSIWTLIIFLGSILWAPAFLEGHMVRLLIKHGCRMSREELRQQYPKDGSVVFVISRLEKRGVIENKDGHIELIQEALDRGFKNRLMLWGTRRVKL